MKIETGVMAIKDGKGWGNIYNDGHSSEDGWVDIEDAEIADPKYCTETTGFTYPKSQYVSELRKGKLVRVERRTEVVVLP